MTTAWYERAGAGLAILTMLVGAPASAAVPGGLPPASSAFTVPASLAPATAAGADPATPATGSQQPPDGGELIPYRRLRVGDFRGDAPPRELAGHGDSLGAAVCVHLTPSPGMEVHARAEWRDGELPVYEATIDELGYRALLDRECSYWRRDGRLPVDYRLEHEQVHFAFFELAARRLNRRLAELLAGLDTRASTAEASIAIVQRLVDEELERATREANELAREFDDDTSGRMRRELQRRWLLRVEAGLREVTEGPGAAGSSRRSAGAQGPQRRRFPPWLRPPPSARPHQLTARGGPRRLPVGRTTSDGGSSLICRRFGAQA